MKATPKIQFKYAATMEFDLAQPETVRGEFGQPNAKAACRRAAEILFKAHPRRQWRSMVVVLEKIEKPVEAVEEPTQEASTVEPTATSGNNSD